MKGIYKIHVKINGISTIALIDEREPYSFITTAFAKAWNLKVKKPFKSKLPDPIIGRVPRFSFSVNRLMMTFSIEVLVNKFNPMMPIMMLGRDWLEFVKAHYTPFSEVLEINYKWNTTWTHITKIPQKFEDDNEEIEPVVNEEICPEESLDELTTNDELLINLNEENITSISIPLPVSKDIFLLDPESF